MLTETFNIYEYEDMQAVQDMSPKEALNILELAYRGYINKYLFPKEGREYLEGEYDDYKIQCAFNVAYKALRMVADFDNKEK